MDNTYVEMGAQVILWGTDSTVSSFHAQYVGKKAIVDSHAFIYNYHWICGVRCGGRRFYWKVQDLILVSDVPLIPLQQRARLKDL